MTSSQEKITEKYFNIIEKALQDTIANENTKSLLREYKDILLDEINIQKNHEKIMQENLNKATSIEDPTLEIKCVKLQETIQLSEKYIDQLRDEIDNLTIESIAQKDTLKIKNEDRKQQQISYYKTEAAKLRKQLNDYETELEKKEQELKNQITLEIATTNARLGEIRRNLERPIVEKNTVLIKMQIEHKELRKELNLLKAQEKLNSKQDKNINPKPSNVMEFHNEFLIQKNPTNIPYNRNECNNDPYESNNEFNNDRNKFHNICQPRINSTISEYSTTETETPEYHEFAKSFDNLRANTFGQPNTNLNKQNIRKFNHNRNYNFDVFNNEHVSSTFSRTSPSTSVSNGNNLNHSNRLTNKEMTYFAEEYDQFNDTQSVTDIDTVNSKILELVPNPWSTVKTGNANKPRNNNYDSLPTLKKCKVEAQSFSTQPNSKLNDTLVIEDPDIFDENLIKKSKTFNYETNSVDVERKIPTVYVGDARKKKTYRQAEGFLPKENYGRRGTPLN